MPRAGAVALLAAIAPALAVIAWWGEAALLGHGVLVALFPVLLAALAAPRRRPAPRLRAVLTLLGLALGASLAALALLRGRVAAPGALPVGLLVQLVGLWLAPLVIVGWGYAWSFREHGIDAAGLERLRALAAESEAE